MTISYRSSLEGSDMAQITKKIFLRIPLGAELTIFPEFFLYCSQTQLKNLCKQITKSLSDPLAVYSEILDILNIFYYFEPITPAAKKKILKKIDMMGELIKCEMTQ